MKTMDTTRKLALAGGVLYLVTFAASIPTLALKTPLVDHANWVLGHGSDKGVILACLMDFVCGVAGIGTAVVLYPIVRRFSRTSAIGFITSRSLEAAILVVGAISLLSVVTLRNNFVGRRHRVTADDQPVTHRRARLVVPVRPRLHARLQRHVPRHGDVPLPSGPPHHPADGIVGAPLLVASAVAAMFGGTRRPPRRPCSPTLPIAAWELSLGVYMTVKGIKRPVVAVDAPAMSPALAA